MIATGNPSKRTLDPEQVQADWLHWWEQPHSPERVAALKRLRRQRRDINNRSGR
jgi:hypothetical protein